VIRSNKAVFLFEKKDTSEGNRRCPQILEGEREVTSQNVQEGVAVGSQLICL
jgi:hypothetical protein